MLAVFFLLGSALLGASLLRRVCRSFLSVPEQFIWGLVLGWAVVTSLIYLFARLQGRLAYTLIVWTTLLTWFVTLILSLPVVRQLRSRALRDMQLAENAGLCLVLVLFTPIFYRLFTTHMMAQGADGIYSGGSSAFDISFHAAVSSAFLYGNNFPPVYTALPPEPLLYPFLPDFLTAVVMRAGLDLHAALMVTAIPFALATVGIFYSLAWRMTRSRRASVLATVLFLLNGGLGFIYFFQDWRNSGLSLPQFWSSMNLNYANLWDRGIHWTNVVTDTLLPQRASLLGLPIGLMIFTIFAFAWRRWSDGVTNKSSVVADQVDEATQTEQQMEAARPSCRAMLLLAGLLAGTLPFIHPHTYFAVGFVSLVLFLLAPRRDWLAFWLPAILLAAPQIISLTQHAAAGGFLHFHPGWMGPAGWRFIPYLMLNFGLPLLLGVVALVAAPRAGRRFYLAFVGLLAFSLLVAVSPNVFDNIKLMLYWHAMNSILIASWLIRMCRFGWPTKVFTALIVLLSIGSGLLALQEESLVHQILFTTEDVRAAAFVREHTPPRSVFLAAPITNQPVLCLAGRSVLRGPTAWLWSHGYEFREREADVRRIYAGAAEAQELVRYYNVDFIYLGEAEKNELHADASFFDRTFPVFYSDAQTRIYDARPTGSSENKSEPARFVSPAPRELAALIDRDPFQLLVEFPRTSFLVYRMFLASYGRMPRAHEFSAEMKKLGRGLFIGAPGWETKLESNAQDSLNGWTDSEEFRSYYAEKSNLEFVNTVLRNARPSAETEIHDRLVRALDSNTMTRAGALRTVIDDRRFYQREYNNAFVLVHFFGYLGRNPDEQPDHDLSGFYYWRNILDHSRDYRSISRAFMEADEYKQRRIK